MKAQRSATDSRDRLKEYLIRQQIQQKLRRLDGRNSGNVGL
jgi:hypothetical protein